MCGSKRIPTAAALFPLWLGPRPHRGGAFLRARVYIQYFRRNLRGRFFFRARKYPQAFCDLLSRALVFQCPLRSAATDCSDSRSAASEAFTFFFRLLHWTSSGRVGRLPAWPFPFSALAISCSSAFIGFVGFLPQKFCPRNFFTRSRHSETSNSVFLAHSDHLREKRLFAAVRVARAPFNFVSFSRMRLGGSFQVGAKRGNFAIDLLQFEKQRNGGMHRKEV